MSDDTATAAGAQRRAPFRPTIRLSIFGGFIGLVLLMLITSLYGILTLQQTGAEVARLDRLNAVARLANDIARRIGDVRLAGVDMMERSGTAGRDNAFRQYDALKRDVDEALLALDDPGQQALLRTIADGLAVFGDGLQRLSGLHEERTAARAGFLAAGEALQQSLDSLDLRSDAADTVPGSTPAPDIQPADAQSLRDEVIATLRRATASLLEDDMEGAAAEADALARQRGQIGALPQRAATVLMRADAAIDQAITTLRQLVAIDLNTGRLRTATLDQEGARIGRITGQLDATTRRMERDAVTRLEGDLERIDRRNLAVALLCLAAAVAGAIGISQITVVPILALTRRMSRLVRGDLASAIPYLDRNNEIGEMARATLAFQRSLHDQQAARAAAEAALVEQRRAEERYRAFFENAVVGIFQSTPEGKVLDANPALAAIMGYATPDELVEKVEDIATQVYVDPHVRSAYLQRLRRDGEVHNFEYRIRRRNGEVRWLSESSRGLRKDGHLVSIQGLISDITDQKRARAALAREQDVMRAILDAVEPGMLVFDDGLRLSVWNAQAVRLLGLPDERMLQRRPSADELALLSVEWGAYGPLPPSGNTHAFLRTLGRHPLGPESDGDFRFITHAGRLFDITTSPLPTGGYLRTLIDVTERERVRAAVAESEHRLRTLIDAVPAIIQIKGPDLRYQVMNRYMGDVFRIDPEEAVGQTTGEILGRHGLSKSTEYDQYVLDTRQPIGFYEEEYTDPTGAHRAWLTKKVPLLDQSGAIDAIATVALDISDRKRVERAMQEARDAAEEAARLKSEFLAMMSHEIRTPMNGIVGMVDVLARSRLDPAQQQTLQVMRESTDSLLRIVNDVLDFSRIEAGRLEIESAPLALVPLLESVTDALSIAARDKDIALAAFVDPDVPAKIVADPVRLRQILVNLIGNAVKFTPRGHVRVVASLDTAPPLATRLLIRVEDSGPGIAAADLDRLFEPFTQAERDPARRAAGTGLGLAIARRIARLMGGDVTAASRPGEGAVFTADLPLHPVADPAGDAGWGGLLDGITVLLGLRSEAERRAIAGYLEAAGARVTAVGDAVEGWAAMVAFRGVEMVAVLEPALLASGIGAAAAGQRVICLAGWEADPDVAAVATVVRPWRRDAILRTVAVAAGRASPELLPFLPNPDMPLPAVPTTAAARAAGQLVLVVDDHPTNRAVLLRQLHLLGCAAIALEDGAGALAALADGGVGLVLTDCHMPGMSGFALTDRIRAHDAGSGRRTPVVAVTANALPGEAERCRAAGMDDYLAKPIGLDALAAIVTRWMPAATATAPAAPAAAAGPAVLDRSVLGDLFGDEPDEIGQMLRAFQETVAAGREDIAQALDRGALAEAGETAHRLKGVAHTIGAGIIAGTAAAIEAAAHAGATDDAAKELIRLGEALAGFAAVIDMDT